MAVVAHKRGRLRAFIVGFGAYLGASLAFGVALIAVPWSVEKDALVLVRPLLLIFCIGIGVAAGKRYLVRFRRIHGIEIGRRADTSNLADPLSPDVQRDVDGCLTTALRFTESSLRGSGAVAPFAVTVSIDGKRAMVRDDYADTEVLYARLRSRATQLRCVAVGAHDPNSGSVVVVIEHNAGSSISVRAAYTGEGRRLTLREPHITQGEPSVFVKVGSESPEANPTDVGSIEQ